MVSKKLKQWTEIKCLLSNLSLIKFSYLPIDLVYFGFLMEFVSVRLFLLFSRPCAHNCAVYVSVLLLFSSSIVFYFLCLCFPPAPFTLSFMYITQLFTVFRIKTLLMIFISTLTRGMHNLAAWHFPSYLKWIIHINESLDLSFLFLLECT